MLISSKDLLSLKDILLWKSYYNGSVFIHDADYDNLSDVIYKLPLFSNEALICGHLENKISSAVTCQ